MAKFHIELDCQSTETSVFEIEANNLEDAIKQAETWEHEPIDTKTTIWGEYTVDMVCSFEIAAKPA